MHTLPVYVFFLFPTSGIFYWGKFESAVVSYKIRGNI